MPSAPRSFKRADEGDTKYGEEIDAEINGRLDSHWAIGLKYAAYPAQEFAVDTRKAWHWSKLVFERGPHPHNTRGVSHESAARRCPRRAALNV